MRAKKRGLKNPTKKGISPVIAYVLVIGFAAALGAIVISWYTNLSKEQSETLLGESESSIDCERVNVNVGMLNFTYPEPANTCSLKILNTGELKITKLKLEFYPSPNIYTPAEVNINPRYFAVIGLPAGESLFEKLYVTPIIDVSGKEVSCPKETIYTQEPGWFDGC